MVLDLNEGLGASPGPSVFWAHRNVTKGFDLRSSDPLELGNSEPHIGPGWALPATNGAGLTSPRTDPA